MNLGVVIAKLAKQPLALLQVGDEELLGDTNLVAASQSNLPYRKDQHVLLLNHAQINKVISAKHVAPRIPTIR